MATYIQEDKYKNPHKFEIAGEAPTAKEREWISKYMSSLAPAVEPEKKKDPSLGELFASGARRGAKTVGDLYETGSAVFGDVAAREHIASEEDTSVQPMALSDISNPMDALKFIGQHGAYLAGNLSVPVAAGAAAGSVLPGPGTGAGALAGALYGGAAMAFADTTREGMKRQMVEGKIAAKDVSGLEAVGGGAVAGGAGLLTGGALGRAVGAPIVRSVVPRGVGKFLAEDVGKMEAKDLAAAAAQTWKQRAGREAVIAGGINAGGGAATEAALRGQSGQSLTDSEGLGALGQAAGTGAVLGAALGAPAGAFSRRGAHAEAELASRKAAKAKEGEIETKRQADLAAAKTQAEADAVNSQADAQLVAIENFLDAEAEAAGRVSARDERQTQTIEAQRLSQERLIEDQRIAQEKAAEPWRLPTAAEETPADRVRRRADRVNAQEDERRAAYDEDAQRNPEAYQRKYGPSPPVIRNEGAIAHGKMEAVRQAAYAEDAKRLYGPPVEPYGPPAPPRAMTARERMDASAATRAQAIEARRVAAEAAAAKQAEDAASVARGRWNTPAQQTEIAHRFAQEQAASADARRPIGMGNHPVVPTVEPGPMPAQPFLRTEPYGPPTQMGPPIPPSRPPGPSRWFPDGSAPHYWTPEFTGPPEAPMGPPTASRWNPDGTPARQGPPEAYGPSAPPVGPPPRSRWYSDGSAPHYGPPEFTGPNLPSRWNQDGTPARQGPPELMGPPTAPRWNADGTRAPFGPPEAPPRRPTPMPDAEPGVFGDSPEARAAMERFQLRGAQPSTPEALAQRDRMAAAEKARLDSEAVAEAIRKIEVEEMAKYVENMQRQPGIDLAKRKRSLDAAKSAATKRTNALKAAYEENARRQTALGQIEDIPQMRAPGEPGISPEVSRVSLDEVRDHSPEAHDAAKKLASKLGVELPEDARLSFMSRFDDANTPTLRRIVFERFANLINGEGKALTAAQRKAAAAIEKTPVRKAAGSARTKTRVEPASVPDPAPPVRTGATAQDNWEASVWRTAEQVRTAWKARNPKGTDKQFNDLVEAAIKVSKVGDDPHAVLQNSSRRVVEMRREAAKEVGKGADPKPVQPATKAADGVVDAEGNADVKKNEKTGRASAEDTTATTALVEKASSKTNGFTEPASVADARALGIEAAGKNADPEARRIAAAVGEDTWAPDERVASRALPNITLKRAYTPQHIIESIIAKGGFSPMEVKLMRFLAKVMPKVDVRVAQAIDYITINHPEHMSPDGIPTRAPASLGMYYKPDESNPASIVLLDRASPQAMARTMLHETVHAVADGKLSYDPAFRDRADMLLDHIKRHLGEDSRHYGLTSVHELFAEPLMRPEFAAALEGIPVSAADRARMGFSGWVKNAWDGLVSMFRRSMRLPETARIDNALSAVLHMIGETTSISKAEKAEYAGRFKRLERTIDEWREDNPQGVYTPERIPGAPRPRVSRGLMEGTSGTEEMPLGERIKPASPSMLNNALFNRSTADIQEFLTKTFKKAPFISEATAKKISFGVTNRVIDEHGALSNFVHAANKAVNGIADVLNPKNLAAHKDSALAYANEQVNVEVNKIAKFMRENGLNRINEKKEDPNTNSRMMIRPTDDVSVESYVLAEHALERNAYGRAIDDEAQIPEDQRHPFSGMTDETARAIIAKTEAHPLAAKYKEAADMYVELAKEATNTLKAYGLIPDDIKGIGERWVPMWDTEFRAEDVNAGAGFNYGSSMRTAAKEHMKARGRVSATQDDVLRNIMVVRQRANRHGMNNEVAQALYKLVKDVSEQAPEANLGRVFGTHWSGLRYDVGDPRYNAYEPGYSEKNKIPVKFDGKLHYMAVEDGRLADLFNSPTIANAEGPKQIIEALSFVMRAIRNTSTMLSPEFAISQFVVDAGEVALKAQGLGIPNFLKSVAKDVKAAGFAMHKMATHEGKHEQFIPSNEMERYALDMAKSGGRTQIWGDSTKNISRFMWDALGVRDESMPVRQAMRDLFMNQTKPGVLGMIRKGFEHIDHLNVGLENSYRLAAFKAVMEAGGTRDQATSLARTITVDFGQGGTWTKALNGLYLFFNASTMGSVGLLSAALRSPAMRELLLKKIAPIGFAMAMAGYTIMGEDEYGTSYYGMIQDYIKQNNFVIPLGHGKDNYIALPMPHGYNVIHNIGRMGAEWHMPSVRPGDREFGHMASKYISNIFQPLFPFGNADNAINGITPTILRMPSELSSNRDSLGRPINPEGLGGRGASPAPSQNYFNSASPMSVGIADWLHRNTGGGASEYSSGAIEVSPGTIDHIIRTYTGSMGSTIIRAASFLGDKTGIAPYGPLHREGANDIPILRRFYREIGPVERQSIFLDVKKDAEGTLMELKRAQNGEGRDPQARLAELYSNPNKVAAARGVEAYLKEYSRLTGQLMKLTHRDIPIEESRDAIEAIQKQRDEIMAYAASQYMKTLNR